MAKKSTTIFLMPEHYQALKMLASYKGKTMSAIAETLIADFLAREKDTVQDAIKNIGKAMDKLPPPG